MIVGPPGEPVTKLNWPSRKSNGGRHGAERTVIRSDGVGVGLDQAEKRVGDAGLGGEIVHFVVEQKSGGASDVGAETVVERVGAGDGVARGIDDGKVRGVRPFTETDDGVRGGCVGG